eukprot:Lithocolla_globosa_v1_NODE_1753_length_2361_cov_15.383781.p4 type:complete len:100 gc:universal NODE_1753_length_2361_cov_15.383781:1101-802(-)
MCSSQSTAVRNLIFYIQTFCYTFRFRHLSTRWNRPALDRTLPLHWHQPVSKSSEWGCGFERENKRCQSSSEPTTPSLNREIGTSCLPNEPLSSTHSLSA